MLPSMTRFSCLTSKSSLLLASASKTDSYLPSTIWMPVLLGMTRNAGCGRHAPQRNCQWAPSARPQRPQLALPVGYSSPRAWGLAALRCEARGVHPNTRLVPTVQLPTAVSIEESLRWATGIGTTSATGQRKSGRSSLASSISLD